MLAEIIQKDRGYEARFERTLPFDSGQVWAMLTDNEKLNQWFLELEIADLRNGGSLTFDMGDGNAVSLEIVDFEEGEVLAFKWWDDEVRFELSAENQQTTLKLIESIRKITPQTAKDLAGWHVCLDVIKSLLKGEEIDRHAEWEKEYTEYKRLLDSITIDFA